MASMRFPKVEALLGEDKAGYYDLDSDKFCED